MAVRRRPGSWRARGVCALLPAVTAVMTVAACGPPTIEDYDPPPDERASCEKFVADLPADLADEGRVDVEPDDALGAAYGDPAITVTCGVPVPADFDQTARCDQVDDVGWFVPDGSDDDRSRDLRLSAPGYRPVVELVVPADYRPEAADVGDATTAAALATLSPIVEKYLTLEQRCEG